MIEEATNKEPISIKYCLKLQAWLIIFHNTFESNDPQRKNVGDSNSRDAILNSKL